MPKICKVETCNNQVFAKLYCKFHQYLRKGAMNKKPKRSKIKAISDKRREENKVYFKRRKKFLDTYKKCQMCHANPNHTDVYDSTEIQHVYRHYGSAYVDEKTWLASCRDCNTLCETDPNWAYDNGFQAKDYMIDYYLKTGELWSI